MPTGPVTRAGFVARSAHTLAASIHEGNQSRARENPAAATTLTA